MKRKTAMKKYKHSTHKVFKNKKCLVLIGLEKMEENRSI